MSASPLATPPSLTQLFNAPDGYRGIFGFVCGYSADAGFLAGALERFTRYTAAQRAAEGRLSLLLMLDPAHPQIAFTAVPGLYHAPFRADVGKSFRLMHAKVALLGFRHEKDADRWQVRLVVSTGNWTRQTVEDSLDLAWHINVDSEALRGKVEAPVRQTCADIAVAWALMKKLRGWYAEGVLAGQTGPADVAAWLEKVSALAGKTRPRFIDNLRASLMDQVLERVPAGNGGWVPNRLAFGSGFYEEGAQGRVPRVLEDMVSRLQKKGAVHREAAVSIYVNPHACQAVAKGFDAIVSRGWTVLAAATPPALCKVPRQLHAKFVFAAHQRASSTACHSAWLYLGSGNLTGPGFCQRAGAEGNLEAGVVLLPEGLQWHGRRGASPGPLVTDLLPIHWDDAITLASEVQAGAGMPPRGPDYVGAPVCFFEWMGANDDGGGRLRPVGSSEEDPFAVVGPDGAPCERASGGDYTWTSRRPRQVEVRWQEHSSLVPVVDSLGRIAADVLPALQLDQALNQLVGFPDPAAVDEDELDEDDDEGDGGRNAVPRKEGRPVRIGQAADYPFRRMMELLETIAARQTALAPSEWPYWCARLEQTLVQAGESAAVDYFRTLGLNPLRVLRAAPFRPDFSLHLPAERQCYERALDRAEQAWRMTGLAPLGEP